MGALLTAALPPDGWWLTQLPACPLCPTGAEQLEVETVLALPTNYWMVSSA